MARTINVGRVVGEQGPAGQDATINGRNTINIVAGENIDIEQDGDTLTIIGEGGGSINSISVNGTTQPIVDKNVDITVPTNTSDLTNNSGFITKSVNDLANYYLKTETYTQTEINNLIGAIQQFHYEIVQQLPTTGANNIMYLVPKTPSETQNYYDEYVYANNNWEKIGDTEIDLSNYVTTTDLNTALANYTTTTDLTTLLAGKQNTIDNSHKLSADLVDDTNSTNKFFSGNYNDLSNKPTIPTALSDLTDDSTHRVVTDTEKTTWNNKSNFSGSYNDLTDKPTIPVVPTNVSAFTNDAGYLTQHQDISGKFDKTSVKTTTDTTQGNVYDVTYINTMLGDIESLLSNI